MSGEWTVAHLDQPPEIREGWYCVIIQSQTYGQGDFGREQVVMLDRGRCPDPGLCRIADHLWIQEGPTYCE